MFHSRPPKYADKIAKSVDCDQVIRLLLSETLSALYAKPYIQKLGNVTVSYEVYFIFCSYLFCAFNNKSGRINFSG